MERLGRATWPEKPRGSGEGDGNRPNTIVGSAAEENAIGRQTCLVARILTPNTVSSRMETSRPPRRVNSEQALGRLNRGILRLTLRKRPRAGSRYYNARAHA